MYTGDVSSQVKAALKSKYCDFEFDDSPIHGTYGLVWIAKSTRNNTRLAFKTVDSSRSDATLDGKDLEYLQREFRKWMLLPPSRNIVGAMGFDLISVYVNGAEIRELPVMRMKAMRGSLEDWISSDEFGARERITAAIQIFLGLSDLYDAGIQGHGDLKPSNILYEDLGKNCWLPEGDTWPSTSNPWRVAIADFGWADAWVDLGCAQMALREYMAPERLDGSFVPQKSDIFAAGAIVAELFLRRHPARNLKKAKKSEGNWRRCVEAANWDIEGLKEMPTLYELVLACLSARAEERPTIDEASSVLHELYDRDSIYPIKDYLKLWSIPLSGLQQAEHIADVSWRTAALGAMQRGHSIFDLQERMQENRLQSLDDFDEWITYAETLVFLLNKDSQSTADQISELLETTRNILLDHLDKYEDSDIDLINQREEWGKKIHRFERYIDVVVKYARLLETDYEKESTGEGEGLSGKVLLSALAMQSASAIKESDPMKAQAMLNEAISLYSTQPVFYYFRGLWLQMHKLIRGMPNLASVSPLTDQEIDQKIKNDFREAARLDPDWEAPKLELSKY